MKRFQIIGAVCAFALCSCATLPQSDRTSLRNHGVAGPVYRKMLYQQPLAVEDVIELSRKRVPDPFVIHYLKSTQNVALNSGDLMRLKQGGISRELGGYLAAASPHYEPPPEQMPNPYPIDPYSYYSSPAYFYYMNESQRNW